MALTSRLAMGLMGVGQTSPGAGACPSALQLAGTVDCTDPCQAPYPPCTPSGTTTTASATALATAASLQACTAAGGVWNANGTCSPAAALAGISTNTILIGGAVVLALFLMMGARR